MRFLDSNVVIYARLNLKRKNDKSTKKNKELSRKIIQRIEKNETVISTVVHFSELINVISSSASLNLAIEVAESVLDNENIIFLDIEKQNYLTALETAKKFKLGINDALALSVMKIIGLNEIYSFDKHFDKIPGIKRITN